MTLVALVHGSLRVLLQSGLVLVLRHHVLVSLAAHRHRVMVVGMGGHFHATCGRAATRTTLGQVLIFQGRF